MNTAITSGFKKYTVSFADLKKLPYGYGVTKIDEAAKQIEYFADYFKEDGSLQDLDDVELKMHQGVLQVVNLYKERKIEEKILARMSTAIHSFDAMHYTL